jgi:hypothetical protein
MPKKLYKLVFSGECSLEAKSKREAQIRVQKLFDAIVEILEEEGLEVWGIDNEVELFEYGGSSSNEEEEEEY